MSPAIRSAFPAAVAEGARTSPLAAGAAAAHQNGVVLLTADNIVPDEVKTHLGGMVGADVFAVGGPGAKAAAASEIEATSIIGSDRYNTAVRVASTFFHDVDGGPDGAVLATGWEFADALAGGAWSGSNGRPVLLTAQGVLPDVTADYISAQSDGDAEFTVSVLGGQSAVSGNVYETLQAAFGDPLVASYADGILSGATTINVGTVTVVIGEDTFSVPVTADGKFSLDVSELEPGSYEATVTAGSGTSAVSEIVAFEIPEPEPEAEPTDKASQGSPESPANDSAETPAG